MVKRTVGGGVVSTLGNGTNSCQGKRDCVCVYCCCYQEYSGAKMNKFPLGTIVRLVLHVSSSHPQHSRQILDSTLVYNALFIVVCQKELAVGNLPHEI